MEPTRVGSRARAAQLGRYADMNWGNEPQFLSVTSCGNIMISWASTGEADNRVPMKGVASRRVLALIAELEAEGVL